MKIWSSIIREKWKVTYTLWFSRCLRIGSQLGYSLDSIRLYYIKGSKSCDHTFRKKKNFRRRSLKPKTETVRRDTFFLSREITLKFLINSIKQKFLKKDLKTHFWKPSHSDLCLGKNYLWVQHFPEVFLSNYL